jgi:hypothetical protein
MTPMTLTLFAFALILGVAALVIALWSWRHTRAGSSENEAATYTALTSLAIVVGTGTQLAFIGRPAAQIAGSVTSILLIGAAVLFRFRKSFINSSSR